MKIPEKDVAEILENMKSDLMKRPEVLLYYIQENVKSDVDSAGSREITAFFAGAKFALENLQINPEELNKDGECH